jgi:hypothetical protein
MVDMPLSPFLYSGLGPENVCWDKVSPIILLVVIMCQPGTVPEELPPAAW